ncbi:AidA/PixA family protein [Streptomyces massasporeus]|uniref:AidA/PixA family protein n=1 Tax=Streptomyces massasporeus TaxID=67324 RepID=UPI0036F7A05B
MRNLGMRQAFPTRPRRSRGDGRVHSLARASGQPSAPPESHWRTTVKRSGKVVYHFSFQILDRHRQLKGYFQWGPFITSEDA